MNRRSLLSSAGTLLAVGTAGCLGDADGGSGSADVHPVELSVESVGSSPESAPVEIDVSLRESTVRDAHPGQVRVTTTNVGTERLRIDVSDHGCGLFNRDRGSSDSPPGLWLVQPGVSRNTDSGDDRWTYAPDWFPAYGCLYPTYDPGESRGNDWQVRDDGDVDGYFEPGTYRWEETIQYEQVEPGADDNDVLGDGAERFQWGFSIRVEE